MSKNPDKPPSENYRKPPKEHQFKKGERMARQSGRERRVNLDEKRQPDFVMIDAVSKFGKL